MKKLGFGLLLLSLWSSLASAAQTVPLLFGVSRLDVELALDPATRAEGLMNRTELPVDQGMLFRFGRPQRVCRWMKNTYIPLSVAFIDGHGQIINMLDMAPHSLEPRCSDRDVVYAVEAEQGWFANHGVQPGWYVQGLMNLP